MKKPSTLILKKGSKYSSNSFFPALLVSTIKECYVLTIVPNNLSDNLKLVIRVSLNVYNSKGLMVGNVTYIDPVSKCVCVSLYDNIDYILPGTILYFKSQKEDFYDWFEIKSLESSKINK